MPRATYKISGDITEFDRIDNLYRALKREGEKLLKNWTIEVTAEFSESQKPSGK